MAEPRMEDFPKCENCGAPIVPDDVGPIWIVTIAREGYPRVQAEDGTCVICGAPMAGSRFAEDEDDDW